MHNNNILNNMKRELILFRTFTSINLLTSPTGKPIITNGPDMDCVADKVKRIRELGLEIKAHRRNTN